MAVNVVSLAELREENPAMNHPSICKINPDRHGRSAVSEGHILVGAGESDFGWIAACWHKDTLARTTIGHSSEAAALRALDIDVTLAVQHELPESHEQFLNRLCRPSKSDNFLDVEIELGHLRPFAQKVVAQCRRIPAGKTVTYAELAARCGSPRAARAVGNVMAKNRFPLVVPCHRVVGAGGRLGGFSVPAGPQLKAALLRREGSHRLEK